MLNELKVFCHVMHNMPTTHFPVFEARPLVILFLKDRILCTYHFCSMSLGQFANSYMYLSKRSPWQTNKSLKPVSTQVTACSCKYRALVRTSGLTWNCFHSFYVCSTVQTLGFSVSAYFTFTINPQFCSLFLFFN